MRPHSDVLRQALLHSLPPHTSVCVAFSGGRDSTVLLHALAGLRQERPFLLRAVHVHHGIQAAASNWGAHCTDLAARLAVPCSILPVTVHNTRGKGLEAEARDARYAAFRRDLQPGEWLLTAHHADDQLETVLLHLLRGSGVSGLAGIPRDAPFGPGRLCRPLIDVPGAALDAYGQEVLRPAGLDWLTDPMNADIAYDRGYVRHELTPVLLRRFPAAARAVGRSAALAAEAAGLLEDLARADADRVAEANRMNLPALRRISPARQRNLVRFLARQRGWATPPERRLREGLGQLLEAAAGRQPVLAWGGHEVRRFRDHLHLLDVAMPDPQDLAQSVAWADGRSVDLGGVRGVLELCPATGGSVLSPGVVAEGLRVSFRSGGERVRSDADGHHRTLKYLFQSRGIVPWMRPNIPLVLAGGRLAAVANLWTADWAAARPGEAGLQIVWTGHAPIV